MKKTLLSRNQVHGDDVTHISLKSLLKMYTQKCYDFALQ